MDQSALVQRGGLDHRGGDYRADAGVGRGAVEVAGAFTLWIVSCARPSSFSFAPTLAAVPRPPSTCARDGPVGRFVPARPPLAEDLPAAQLRDPVSPCPHIVVEVCS